MRPALSSSAVAALLFLSLVEGRALASTIMVGPGDDYTKIEAAQAGDTVLIQPGTYQFRVYLSGTGTAAMPITIMAADPKNPPVWDLGGKPVNQWPGSYTGGDNDRGCWQVGGGSFYVIESIEFQNCRNGIDAAGIRTHASTSLRVRDVHIHDCDDGFTGDGTDTVVEFSELDHNGYVPASQETHNIYIYDGDFTLRYSFVHDSTHGQNFHIRAQNALLEYNWIARAQNYEGDMASTGTPGKQSMTLRGNVILGNPSPENHGQFLALSNDSGTGGYSFDLTAVWNTMIVQTPTNPVLVNVVNDTLDAASVTLSNNILVGTNAMIVPGDPAKSNTTVQGTNNWMETGAAPGGLLASIMGASPGFNDAMNLDFTLAPGSMAIGAASAGVTGAPTEEYFQNETVKERFRFRLSAKDLGAFEHDTMGMSYGPYDSPTPPGTSSSSGAGAGGASGSGSGGTGAAGGSAQVSGSGGGSSGQKGGCGCREAPAERGSPAALVVLAGLAAAAARSRRRRE